MKNFIKIIFLFKVLAIIFLHSLISHAHHGEFIFDKHHLTHKKASNIIDYLGLIFHNDINESLENYIISEQNISKKNDFQNKYFGAIGNFISEFFFHLNRNFNLKQQTQKLPDNFNSNKLRAPPSLT